MQKIIYNERDLRNHIEKRKVEPIIEILTDVQNYSLKLKEEINQIIIKRRLEEQNNPSTLDSLVSLGMGVMQKGKKYFQDKF